MRESGGAGRYAPSPSGALHLGNLRTAMLAWLFARHSGRAFRLRIEDIDHTRDVGATPQQLADLAELGIDWDGEVVIQSDRRWAHECAIRTLADRGLVYECTCTRREIQEAPRAPHGAPGAYPGTCRNRSEPERIAARRRIAPRRPALRLRAPEGWGEVTFTDQILGEVHGRVDDFVLRRGDGAFAYNLAVVVDDAAMQVDQVVRGDDLLLSTPRQIALQRLLDLPSTPEVTYAHVPLVLGPTGKRLAKRDGAVTLRELKSAGITAHVVRNRLAVTLGLAQPGEANSMDQLLSRFDPGELPRRPWVWSADERASTSGP